MADNKAHVSIVSGKALVFDLEDVKKLRTFGITGVLSGTLPTAPQQNVFLGLPLQLMVEELVWLVQQDAADLFPEKSFIDELVGSLSDDEIGAMQRSRYQEFESQKEEKTKQKQDRINANSKNHSGQIPSDVSIAKSLFINISNTPNNLPNHELFKSIFIKNTKLQKQLLDSLKYEPLNYKVFKHLKKSGYFLAPGLRFGGKFIAYPGDPLRYHAHLIVNSIPWEQDIGLMNIVSGGRLATGVKKIWLIGSEEEKDDDEAVCFSVEWAGFG